MYGIRLKSWRNELEANPKAGNLLSLSEFGPRKATGLINLDTQGPPSTFRLEGLLRDSILRHLTGSHPEYRGLLYLFSIIRRVSRADYNHLVSILNLFI